MSKGKLRELSNLHIETLRRLANGETYASIESHMHYSYHGSAVQYNLRIARRILGAQNNVQAVYIAAKRGII